MPRYIDAERFKLWLQENYAPCDRYFIDIDAQPTADVVEVVRCKDCKHWNRDEEYCVDFLTQDKNGFCSWWERREDAEIH